MKRTHLLALTSALMIATGTAFAGPNCKKNCPKNNGDSASQEGVYEVAERDGEARPERGERGDRSKRHHPLHGLDLSDDQKEQVKAIMEGAREQSKAIMEEVKAKKEAGEEIDREAVREQMMAVRKAAMENVYENVLTAEQQEKLDERRKQMEERRAEREAEGGDRPERGERKGRGEKKDRGGDEGLDL